MANPNDDAPGKVGARRQRLLRSTAVVFVAPVLTYFVVRPFVDSDTFGLAVAGMIPLVYNLGLGLWKRLIDALALVSSVGFTIGCLVALLSGGNSLPLKLHEAFVTFAIGIVLLVAAISRHPVPLGRLLRLPAPTPKLEMTLDAIIGSFLVLHSLLHFALAATLSTSSYLVAGRLVNGATLAIGAVFLFAFLRHLRAEIDRKPPSDGAGAHGQEPQGTESRYEGSPQH